MLIILFYGKKINYKLSCFYGQFYINKNSYSAHTNSERGECEVSDMEKNNTNNKTTSTLKNSKPFEIKSKMDIPYMRESEDSPTVR